MHAAALHHFSYVNKRVPSLFLWVTLLIFLHCWICKGKKLNIKFQEKSDKRMLMLWWRRQVRNEGMNGGDARMNLWNWEFCVHFLLSVLTVRTNWFFLAPQVKAHAYDSFFFLPFSSISQTFGLIAPIFVRYPLNDVNVWVGLGLTNLNCWEKILQKNF